MSDKIKNFYLEIKQDKKVNDKNYKNHMILPNSRIALIGGSGTGKTQFLLNFLDRVGPKFYELYIYTTDTEEKLLSLLKSKIPEAVITNNIDDIPPISDYSEDKTHEKLVVFDDFITLNNKQMKKLEDYAIAGRKYSITSIFMAQNYRQIPKNITRNLNYIILFKLNDNTTLRSILYNHNIHDISKDKLKHFYNIATINKFNFLLLDLNAENKDIAYRHNFLNILR
jgi:hypothetical protein